MFLIADSGSTKTEWALLENGKLLKKVQTKGFNPYYYQKSDFISDVQSSLRASVPFDQVVKVYYYGSGCSTVQHCTLVEDSLSKVFRNAQIETGHDLFASGLS